MVKIMSSFKDDIDKLSAQWDKALAAGIFDDVKPKQQTNNNNKEVDFFGQMTGKDSEITDSDISNWKDVMVTLGDSSFSNKESYSDNSYSDQSDESDVFLNEEKTPSKKKIKSHSKKMANTNNPVYPNTIGKDNKIKPENNFTNGKLLDDLIELKSKLHSMLSEMQKNETLGKDSKSAQSAIDKMFKEIDKLSDSLNGSTIDTKK